jgi:predicted HicB family RNase H-like nuclease
MRNMKEIFEYNGYYGSTEVEEHTTYGAVYYGKLLFMKDSITYESLDEGLLYFEFAEAVEDYIETCEGLGKVPQKVVINRGEG